MLNDYYPEWLGKRLQSQMDLSPLKYGSTEPLHQDQWKTNLPTRSFLGCALVGVVFQGSAIHVESGRVITFTVIKYSGGS